MDCQSVLISVIRSELTKTALDPVVLNCITDEILSELYVLSKAHDLSHIVSSVIEKYKIAGNKELIKKFQKQEMLAVYRTTQLQYETNRLKDMLNEAGVPFVLLKGAVIRPYYPAEHMRTSCDIDVLVNRENVKKAGKLIEKQLEGRKLEAGHYDITYALPSGVHIEVHYALPEGKEKADRILETVWEYACPYEKSQFKLKDEFFVFYHFAHMAKHFKNGGCGIRPFMDLWIIENSMRIDLRCADNLLQKAELDKFAKGAIELTEAWFGDKPKSNLTENMQEYIFSAGLYGSIENGVTMSRTEKSGFGHIWNRLFLPYSQMTEYFPSLKKAPVLLPLFWVVRVLRVIFGGRLNKRITEAKTSINVSDEELEKVRELAVKLGLKG